MSEKLKVTTLKGFHNGGQYVGRNREIEVTETRARDLERNGLITREVVKAAPRPKNKKAAEPKNKKSPEAEDKAD